MSIARRASSWRGSPGAGASLSLQIARLVESIRKEDLRKVPGVAETLDWAAALVGLDVRDLHDAPETVHETLMCLLKTHEDRSRVTPRGHANGCWGRSHELLRRQPRLRRTRRGLPPRLGEARGVSPDPARQRLCRRPARRPRRRGADGGGLCRNARAAALGVQASVLGAQVRLGQIRRPVRRVLARQAGELALDHHGLGARPPTARR